MLVDADAVGDVQGQVPAVDGRSGVALFVGRVPIGGVAGELQVQLARLHLGLLQAEEIGVQVYENVRKPFAGHGPQAIDIPGYEFHVIRGSRWCLPCRLSR